MECESEQGREVCPGEQAERPVMAKLRSSLWAVVGMTGTSEARKRKLDMAFCLGQNEMESWGAGTSQQLEDSFSSGKNSFSRPRVGPAGSLCWLDWPSAPIKCHLH